MADELARDLAFTTSLKLVEKMDELILVQIRKVTLDDVKDLAIEGRLRSVQFGANSKITTYYLDNRPLITVQDIEVRPDPADHMKLISTIRYQTHET